MKKILLFLMFALFCVPWAANAQTTLTVCDGTDNSDKVPFDGYNADSQQHNQMIFPATDLSAMNGKEITQMVFYIDQSASNGSYTAANRLGTWTVSLGETEATTLDGLDNTTTLTQVYQGYFDCSTGTLTLAFSNNYIYHGGNLLVDLNHAASSWNTWYFLGENQEGVTAITRGTNYQFLPKTTFSYQTPPTCPAPTLNAAEYVTEDQASFTWTENGSATNWVLQYSTSEDFTNAISRNRQGIPILVISDFQPLTTYYVRVKADCGEGDQSLWSNVISFSTTAVAQYVDDGWSDDFEGTDFGWELINGTLTNAWTWGTATSNGGTHALYVSNNGGTTNAYTNNSAAMVYAAKLLAFDGGKYEFTYDWNGNGESSYDYLRVVLVPASVILTAGTSTPSGFSYSDLPDGWIALDGGSKLNQVTAWQSKSVIINVPQGNYYLVLAWRNDTSDGTNPPAAVDNVSVTPMACPYDVTDLAVSDITTTGATLTWTADEAEQWQVAYGTDNNFEGATEEIVSTASYNISGLQSNSIYYVKVRAYCGGEDFGAWSDVLSFATECNVIDALGYTENFDSYTAGNNVLPTCWSYINTTTNSTYAVYPRVYANSSYSTYANSAPNCLYFYSYGSSDPQSQYAILPEMTGLAGLQVTLMAKGYSATSTFKIGTMSDPADTNTFTMIAEQTLTTSYPTDPFEYLIPADCRDSYLAIMMDAAPSGYNTRGVYVDDIVIREAPTCLKPTDLELVSATTTTATLNWTVNGNETAWQIMLNDDEDNLIMATDNQWDIEGLTAATSYTAKVRAYCGEDSQSEWSSEVSFTTLCEAITTFPWTENFNSLTAGIPTCWDNSEGTTTTLHYMWNYFDSGHEGAGLRFNSYNNTNGLTNFLKTVSLSLPSDQLMQLSFWYKNPTGGDFSVYISTDGGATHETALVTGLTGVSTWTEQPAISLADYAGQEVVIVFKGTSNYGNGDAYIYLDDVTVMEVPTCLKPNGLEVTATTTTTATLNWTVNGNETAWQIMLNDDENNLIMATDNQWDIEDLAASTAYTAKVRAYCSEDDQSDWSNEVSFATACEYIVVDAANPFTEGFEGTWPPLCWESIPIMVNGNLYKWQFTNSQSYNGSQAAYSNYYGPILLMMPELQLGTDGDAAQLTFWSYNSFVNDYDKNSVVLLNGDEEIELWSPESVVNAWEEVTIDLTQYMGQNISLAFKYEGNNAHGWYIDDVNVEVVAASGCAKILVDAQNPEWSEDFEDDAAGITTSYTGILPACWSVPMEYTSAEGDVTPPQVYYKPDFNATDGGSYSLRMRYRSMLAMPELDENVDFEHLKMGLYVRQSFWSYKLEIGVITDIDNPDESYHMVATVNNSDKNVNYFECNFASVKDLVGEGRYIVFKNVGGSEGDLYSNNYLDDITLTYVDNEDVNCQITESYNEDFEAYAVGAEPDCWEVIMEDVALDSETRPQVYGNFNTTAGGSKSLRLKNRCVYAMPAFGEYYSISNFTMTFNLRQPKSIYRLQVGLVDAEGNFNIVKTFKCSNTTDMQPMSVSFSNLDFPYTDDMRVAFRNTLVPGTGMSTEYLDYSINYIDDISFFYEAKGKVEANADALDANVSLEDIAVYPNPTTGNLYIDAVDIQKVECYNQMGQLVRVYDNVRNSIDLNNLSEGVYTLRITVPQGVTMRKVVKR